MPPIPQVGFLWIFFPLLEGIPSFLCSVDLFCCSPSTSVQRQDLSSAKFHSLSLEPGLAQCYKHKAWLYFMLVL